MENHWFTRHPQGVALQVKKVMQDQVRMAMQDQARMVMQDHGKMTMQNWRRMLGLKPAGLLLLVFPISLFGQAAPHRLDADIVAMLNEVSSKRLEATVRQLAGFGTRQSMSDTDSETRGIGAARRWIKSEFERYSADSGGRLKVSFETFRHGPDGRRIDKPTDIVNVVAVLPGRSDRVFVVGGHYDSIPSDPTDSTTDAPGANDDASGVACAMELARIMSHYEFDATLMFIAFAGEEQGLIGSNYQAAKARKDGLNIEGVFNNDTIGSSTDHRGRVDASKVRIYSIGVGESETDEERRLRLALGSENDSDSRQLARFTRETAGQYVPGIDAQLMYRRDRLGRGGDHTSYNRHGFPAIRIVEWAENFAHQHQNPRMEDGVQYGDLPEFVDFDYLAQVTRVNLAAMANVARAPAKPRNVRIIYGRMSHVSEILWEKSDEEHLWGYELLYRETTEAEWTHVIPLGNVTRYADDTLSKDHYLFAVRVVDRDGHRSLPVLAMPERGRRR